MKTFKLSRRTNKNSPSMLEFPFKTRSLSCNVEMFSIQKYILVITPFIRIANELCDHLVFTSPRLCYLLQCCEKQPIHPIFTYFHQISHIYFFFGCGVDEVLFAAFVFTQPIRTDFSRISLQMHFFQLLSLLATGNCCCPLFFTLDFFSAKC